MHLIGRLIGLRVEGFAKINFDVPAVGKCLDKSHFPLIQVLVDHRQSAQYIKDGAGAGGAYQGIDQVQAFLFFQFQGTLDLAPETFTPLHAHPQTDSDHQEKQGQGELDRHVGKNHQVGIDERVFDQEREGGNNADKLRGNGDTFRYDWLVFTRPDLVGGQVGFDHGQHNCAHDQHIDELFE